MNSQINQHRKLIQVYVGHINIHDKHALVIHDKYLFVIQKWSYLTNLLKNLSFQKINLSFQINMSFQKINLFFTLINSSHRKLICHTSFESIDLSCNKINLSCWMYNLQEKERLHCTTGIQFQMDNKFNPSLHSNIYINSNKLSLKLHADRVMMVGDTISPCSAI